MLLATRIDFSHLIAGAFAGRFIVRLAQAMRAAAEVIREARAGRR